MRIFFLLFAFSLWASPKAELHLHLSGAFPIDFIQSIATEDEFIALQANLDQISERGLSYHEAFSVFNLVYKIVNTNEKVEEGTAALCRELEEDGVTYAEIRTGLRNLGGGHERYLQAVLNGAAKSQLQPKILLSLRRSSSLAVAKETVDLALKYGLVGIDISGDSTIGNIETILPEILRAKEAGLFLTLHIGESPKEEGQLECLEILQPDRVGHAVFLQDEAKKWVLERKIPIEMCLTSGVLAGMIAEFSEHPALDYFANGHPVVFCTDDPLIFRTCLSKEKKILTELIGISGAEEMSQKAFDHVFVK